MVSAGVCFGGKGRLTTPLCKSLLTRALKWILHTTLAVSFPVLSTTALDCCPVEISSRKMARQHTQLVPRRTGSKPIAQISLPKTSGLRIHPTWTPWITMSGGNVGGLRNRKRSPNWRKSCRWSGTPSGTNRQSCKRVLKATKGLCCSWQWTFRTFTVTAMSWLCYSCLNDVILLRDCLDIFERAKIARWQHCNADNFRTL